MSRGYAPAVHVDPPLQELPRGCGVQIAGKCDDSFLVIVLVFILGPLAVLALLADWDLDTLGREALAQWGAFTDAWELLGREDTEGFAVTACKNRGLHNLAGRLPLAGARGANIDKRKAQATRARLVSILRVPMRKKKLEGSSALLTGKCPRYECSNLA